MKTSQPPSILLAFITAAFLPLAGGSVVAADYHALNEIPVGGAGSFDYLTVDSVSRRLYVSHGTKVVVIDLENGTIAGEVADTPGVHGIAIASSLRRGFTSNGREAKASVFQLDILTGKVVSTVPIGEGVDANAFDAETQLAFSSNGDGTVTIAHEDSPDKLMVVQTLKMQKGARTMALDPKPHVLYLPVGSGVSFRIIVYGK